jgi:predicted O-methyltransferase YrrM
MTLKHWPIVRDLRFAQKSGRYLRGARKRRPDLRWEEFRRIARHFKCDEMGDIAERGFLFQLASDLPVDAQVVEIGSWIGASSCCLAGGLRGGEARIFAVDNFEGRATCVEDVAWYQREFRRLGTPGTLALFRQNVAALGFARRIEPVVADSLAAAERLAAKRGRLDLVFIDGDHAYAACAADIATWTPFVRAGGVVALHDFGSRAEGVTRAVFDAVRAGRFAEIVGVAGTVVAFRV